MKEYIDESTGAIIFKSDPEDPMERKVTALEHKVAFLESKIIEILAILEKSSK